MASIGIFSPDLSNEVIFSHDPAYLFMVHDRVFIPLQMHFYLTPAVFLLAFVENIFNQQVIGIILVRFVLSLYPSVVSAARNIGDIATNCNIFIRYLDDFVFLAGP